MLKEYNGESYITIDKDDGLTIKVPIFKVVNNIKYYDDIILYQDDTLKLEVKCDRLRIHTFKYKMVWTLERLYQYRGDKTYKNFRICAGDYIMPRDWLLDDIRNLSNMINKSIDDLFHEENYRKYCQKIKNDLMMEELIK